MIDFTFLQFYLCLFFLNASLEDCLVKPHVDVIAGTLAAYDEWLEKIGIGEGERGD